MSMRDDMESLSYTILYLLLGGRLPWLTSRVNQQLLQNPVLAVVLILTAKANMNPDQICADFPPVFARFINFTRNLTPDDPINYEQLKEELEIAASH